MKRREILLSISIVAIFVFLVVFYFNIYEAYQQENQTRIEDLNQFPNRPPIPNQYRVWLSPLLLIIAIVPVSYYLISRKLENNMKVILKLIDKSNVNGGNNTKNVTLGSNNKNTILKLLNFNERKILEKLIDERGEALQSELSQMEGMNKLKAHRAIRNLELRGVIKTENYGKTRRVLLSKDIKNIL